MSPGVDAVSELNVSLVLSTATGNFPLDTPAFSYSKQHSKFQIDLEIGDTQRAKELSVLFNSQVSPSLKNASLVLVWFDAYMGANIFPK